MGTPPPAGRLVEAPTDDGRRQPLLRLAPARRQRRPAFIVLGLVLILVGGALAAQGYLRVGGRSAVLTVARPIAAGHSIAAQDLTEVRISVDPAVHAVPASDRNQIVGRVAAVDLLPQSLLPREAVAAASVPAPAQAIVGVALKPGQMPNNLKAGDSVMIVLTPPANGGGPAAAGQAARVLVDHAEVFDLRAADADQSTVVSVVVAREQAAAVANAQATGQVSLVLVAASS